MTAPTRPTAAETLLAVRELEVGYGGRALLPPANFAVRAGECWAIVGPNGGGKTTFLRSVLGLLPFVSGAVSWSSVSWGSRERPALGYVPQRSAMDLEVPARVIDIVRDGVEVGWSFAVPWSRRARADRVARALRDTGISRELASRSFALISEGHKQRVLLARALAADPRLLMLDEPTAAMDAEAERDVMALIDELRTRRHLAVMVVSHHLPIVARHATHLLLVDQESGLLVAGPKAQVAVLPECQERYGRLFVPADGPKEAAP